MSFLILTSTFQNPCLSPHFLSNQTELSFMLICQSFFSFVLQSILIISFCGVPSVYVFNVWFLGFELDFCADDSKE